MAEFFNKSILPIFSLMIVNVKAALLVIIYPSLFFPSVVFVSLDSISLLCINFKDSNF